MNTHVCIYVYIHIWQVVYDSKNTMYVGEFCYHFAGWKYLASGIFHDSFSFLLAFYDLCGFCVDSGPKYQAYLYWAATS